MQFHCLAKLKLKRDADSDLLYALFEASRAFLMEVAANGPVQ